MHGKFKTLLVSFQLSYIPVSIPCMLAMLFINCSELDFYKIDCHWFLYKRCNCLMCVTYRSKWLPKP